MAEQTNCSRLWLFKLDCVFILPLLNWARLLVFTAVNIFLRKYECETMKVLWCC